MNRRRIFIVSYFLIDDNRGIDFVLASLIKIQLFLIINNLLFMHPMFHYVPLLVYYIILPISKL